MSDSTTLSRGDYDALIFDLDGVITDTAQTHRKAWKEVFDQVLEEHLGADYRPFDVDDYRRYVDGKPRFEGVRSFLSSRNLHLPEGEIGEGPDLETVYGIGMEKNERYQERIAEGQLSVFDDALELLEAAEQARFGLGLVSSSRNAGLILEILGLSDRFGARVDGQTLAEENLAGKPAPDMFVEASRRLGVEPRRAVVIEDAESGVRAGRAGGFGLVIGLGRGGEEECRILREHGADLALTSLAPLKVVDEEGKYG